jgi:hypothetical protein
MSPEGRKREPAIVIDPPEIRLRSVSLQVERGLGSRRRHLPQEADEIGTAEPAAKRPRGRRPAAEAVAWQARARRLCAVKLVAAIRGCLDPVIRDSLFQCGHRFL